MQHSEGTNTNELNRRQMNRAMAWSVPAVLVAVAAPAAQGSQPPPVDTNPCTNGSLEFLPLDKWQKGSGGDLWQTLEVYNHTSADIDIAGRVEHASTHLRGVGGAETFIADDPNSANWTATVPAEGSLIMNVFVEEESDNDSCWFYVNSCGFRLHMKTIGKIDRLESSGS